MEINITDFFRGSDPHYYSASQAEIGANAGAITWANANDHAAKNPILTNTEHLEEYREHIRGYGAWSEDEIAAWSDTELNALFIQDISAEIREMGEMSWSEYEKAANDGQVSGRLFVSDDGQVYFYIGE